MALGLFDSKDKNKFLCINISPYLNEIQQDVIVLTVILSANYNKES